MRANTAEEAVARSFGERGVCVVVVVGSDLGGEALVCRGSVGSRRRRRMGWRGGRMSNVDGGGRVGGEGRVEGVAIGIL